MRMYEEKITIGEYTCSSGLIQGGKRFTLSFLKESIFDYHEKMFGKNQCKSLLPIFLFKNEKTVDIYYEVSGYMKLSEYFQLQQMRKSTMFHIVKNILHCIRDCENYMLLPEQLPLVSDLIFVNSVTKEIRLLFLPAYENPDSVRNSLIKIMSQVECHKEESDDYTGLLSQMKTKFFTGNPGSRQMLRILEEIERESNYLNWTKGLEELGDDNNQVSDLEEKDQEDGIQETGIKYKLKVQWEEWMAAINTSITKGR